MKKFFSSMLLVSLFCLSFNLAFAYFVDVSTSNPYYDAINYVDNADIAHGYSDGTFRPYNLINRAEFTKIIVEATVAIDEIYGNNCYTDVTDQWFAEYVCTAQRKGIATGYPNGSFGVAENIDFVDASKIIILGFNYTPGQNTTNTWYQPYVSILSNKNAIPTSLTGLSQNINRGEMSEIIYRLKNNITYKSSMVYNANTNRLNNPGETPPSPNPDKAHSYCLANNGLIKHSENYDYCVFLNGSQCEVWAYYNGSCSPEPTDTPEEYCREKNGTVSRYNNNKICEFSNNSYCNIDDFYNKKCYRGDHYFPTPKPDKDTYCRNNGGKPDWYDNQHVCSFGLTYCNLDSFYNGNCTQSSATPYPPAPNPTVNYKPYCISNGGFVSGSDCIFESSMSYCSLQYFYDGVCKQGDQQIINPSVYYGPYCTNQGGTVDGNYCTFDDGSTCKLQLFFQQQCHKGDIPKPAPNPSVNYGPYCISSGGTVSGDNCVFSDGSYCGLQKFYQDECKKGENYLLKNIMGPGLQLTNNQYCIKEGGTVTGDNCTFNDGSYCTLDSFYAETCKKGDQKLLK